MEYLWEAGVLLASVAYSLWQFWKFYQTKKANSENVWHALLRSAVSAAVTKVYQEMVRDWKVEGDGKLSTEQKNTALQTAAQYAKEIADAHGLDISSKVTTEELLDYIEQMVTAKKGLAGI